MKKIGILFGMERSFPYAFIERVNQKQSDFVAEPVSIDRVEQGVATDYAVIIDRISQDVPFYKAFLKNAALMGTAVVNNPFWWSADEKFFNNALATQLGVPVPKTILLPSKHRPDDTRHESFSNLQHMDWNAIFERIGFPAFMKPHSGGGWKNVYKVDNAEEMFSAYDETGQLVMLYQEAIDFTDYFRCYCIGGKDVRIMPYEPRNPHHLRYATEMKTTGDAGKKLIETMTDYVLKLNHGLGYDFNTVEFAVRDGIPIAIDFCNPAPDADINSVGQANFDWVVEAAANMAIERAKRVQAGKDNLTWGTFVRGSVGGTGMQPASAEKPAKATKAAIGEAIQEDKAMAPEKKAEKKAPKADKKAEAPKAEKPKAEKKAKK
ncbi:RimK family alpha-L-glutamate ligase [Fibrella sp. WM1]|uniref:ATP-grasp domain-containing protein n=1 Tax=Fibrella musci TaxID=3242485 RepID=UPI00351FF631